MTRDEIKAKIKKLDEEKVKLEASLKQSPEIQVAEYMHSKLCTGNHTDQCPWEYDTWEKTPLDYARKRYLEQSKELLQVVADMTGYGSSEEPQWAIDYCFQIINIIAKY